MLKYEHSLDRAFLSFIKSLTKRTAISFESQLISINICGPNREFYPRNCIFHVESQSFILVPNQYMYKNNCIFILTRVVKLNTNMKFSSCIIARWRLGSRFFFMNYVIDSLHSILLNDKDDQPMIFYKVVKKLKI